MERQDERLGECMKIGEVWQDRQDGQRVKIKKIKYGFNKSLMDNRDYIVSFEDLQGTTGGDMAGKHFVIQFEKCYGD